MKRVLNAYSFPFQQVSKIVNKRSIMCVECHKIIIKKNVNYHYYRVVFGIDVLASN